MFSEAASNAGWRRSGSNICYYQNHYGNHHARKHKGESNNFYTLTFTMEFAEQDDRCHLAYCYPYTYTRLTRFLDRMISSHPAVIRRRCLCQTLEGYNCELLTITDFECSQEKLRQRRGVVLTARVHPGESNASWIMEVSLVIPKWLTSLVLSI